MKINWKIRFQSKTFVIAFFSLTLLLSQQVLGMFGVDITAFTEEITGIFNTLLAIAVLVGVVHDSTTKGLGDCEHTLQAKEQFKGNKH